MDTSIILRHVFDEGPRFDVWGRYGDIYASEILRVEAYRVLHRRRLLREITDDEMGKAVTALNELLAHVGTIRLSASVLRRAAEPFPTQVKTLDALHLASALAWSQYVHEPDVIFATHDKQQATAARSLGFTVVGGAET